MGGQDFDLLTQWVSPPVAAGGLSQAGTPSSAVGKPVFSAPSPRAGRKLQGVMQVEAVD